ncbi:MAG: class I SAM-dependent methyltransferase, partial [Pseudomonadota bacterium]|nr:class I SAM-dependent methyltransferase [Pseudomonadota bacterium]
MMNREQYSEITPTRANSRNIDPATVDGFGEEWAAFDQTKLDGDDYEGQFDAYFAIFPFDSLPAGAEGFDLGCGSGRWAARVATRVGKLHCIDPSAKALAVARQRLADQPNATFHLASSDTIPLADNSQDFGYALGVLHHIPDTRRALSDCVAKIKPGAPFLVYLYYALDGRPAWFRALWRATDVARRGIFRLPFGARKAVAEVIAATVYWPLTRAALIGERLGRDVSNVPLSAYRHRAYYSMRTDALDRFGTRLEQRFTRAKVAEMMTAAGL